MAAAPTLRFHEDVTQNRVVAQDENKDQREIEKVSVNVLQNEREPAFAPIGFARLTDGAVGWILPERFVIRAAVVVTREAKSAGRPQDQQRGRDGKKSEQSMG